MIDPLNPLKPVTDATGVMTTAVPNIPPKPITPIQQVNVQSQLSRQPILMRGWQLLTQYRQLRFNLFLAKILMRD